MGEVETVKKEVPEGRRMVEMALVRLFRRRQAWADVLDIANALINVEHQANAMEAESRHLHGHESDGNSRAEPPFTPL